MPLDLVQPDEGAISWSGDVNTNFDQIQTQVNEHFAAAAPHSGHEQTANKGQAGGYASLDGSSKVVQDPAAHASTHAYGGSDVVAACKVRVGAYEDRGAAVAGAVYIANSGAKTGMWVGW